jgi:histidinol-phosphate/aromatic aminotransferase/cobyric acid decarboxylase-like protein
MRPMNSTNATRPRRLFRPNDFDSVYYGSFQEIWDSGQVYADPSGWRDTESRAAALLPAIQIEEAALGRYYLDEGNTLGGLKSQILDLVGSWEKRCLALEEITLYNSVSTAASAVLVTLKRRGARTVVFETPAYGVTVNQARQLGYRVVLVPTYYEEGFVLTVDHELLRRDGPVVMWLTQPRMSLGFDQSEEHVENLLSALSPLDYLVVDEATEQRYPPVLSGVSVKDRSQRVLRIRGILKGLGLNGLRLACVLHSSELREGLESAQDVIGASLDLFSLQMAAELAKRKDVFLTMLSVANTQVTSLRRRAELLALGSQVRVSHLVNGYMGSVFIPLNGGKAKYKLNRDKLVSYCRTKRMPVILGSSMFFAFDPQWEQIRFNYFSRESHVIRAMEVLTAFV